MIRFATYQACIEAIGRMVYFVRRFALSLALLFGVVYLGFHAAHGERGLIALNLLQDKKHTHQAMLAELQAKNADLRRKIDLLSGDNPDRDFLEERVRKVLGFAYPDENILIFDPKIGRNDS